MGVRQLGVLGAIYFNVAFSPDGRTLAADFAGNTPPEVGYLLLLDAGSGKLLKKLSCYGSTAWLAFSPDGTTLAVGQGKAQGMVKCYYVSTGKTA